MVLKDFFIGLISGGILVGFISWLTRKSSAHHFENLANQILNSTQDRGTDIQKQNLNEVVSPLKEKLDSFNKKVEQLYSSESRERFSLQNEIERFGKLNSEMVKETHQLSSALRGDVKVQGAWGEMILERVLEESGLRRGHEFVTQGEMLKLVDSDGNRYRPDVVVNFPDNQHVVIDSKVSLTHYEQYFHLDDSKEKATLLKQFIASVKKHIDTLSDKAYENLEGLNSPSFVFMFMPIEGAFSLLIQNDENLLTYAWEKNICLVGPVTLMANLKTIASVWKIEKQNQNAQEIAKRGGLLYDKFVAFYDDLIKIGETMDRSQKHYQSALNRLQNGKGNLVSQANELKEMGVKTSKSL